jgi:hypothetical protein
MIGYVRFGSLADMATCPRDARFTSDSRYTLTRVFTQFVYGDHAATRSISVGSSPGARELFTRCDTKAMLLSKAAIVAGGIWILALLIGAIRFDSTTAIGAMAAIIGRYSARIPQSHRARQCHGHRLTVTPPQRRPAHPRVRSTSASMRYRVGPNSSDISARKPSLVVRPVRRSGICPGLHF